MLRPCARLCCLFPASRTVIAGLAASPATFITTSASAQHRQVLFSHTRTFSSSMSNVKATEVLPPPPGIPRVTPMPDYVRPPAANPDGTMAEDPARRIRIAPFRQHFRKTLDVLAVDMPAGASSRLIGAAETRPFVLAAKLVRPICHHPTDPSRRLLMLRVQEEAELDDAAKGLIAEVGGKLVPHKFEIGYDYFDADQVLGPLLPESQDGNGPPTSFTIIGHIAHVNLRDEHLPYRFLIGDVLLDKNQRVIRTVVNKLDSIDAQFRFFDMELLAGEPEFTTVAHEQNCSFTFDFRKVYFNTRLNTEHSRITQLEFRAADVVIDVMAGVGPFAVPAARKERGNIDNHTSALHALTGGPGNEQAGKGKANSSKDGAINFDAEDAGPCWVLANDLNPSSMESLAINVVDNAVAPRVFLARAQDIQEQDASKTRAHFVDAEPASTKTADNEPIGLDGREFIRRATRWAWDGVRWPPGKVSAYKPNTKQAASASRTRPRSKSNTPSRQRESHLVGAALLETAKEPERRWKVPKPIAPPGKLPQHFVMNLPDSALTFLDAYRGLYSRIFDGEGERAAVERELMGRDARGRPRKYPLVHVHCFTKALEDPYEDIIARANRALGYPEGQEGGTASTGLQVPQYRTRPARSAARTAAETSKEGEPSLCSIQPVTGDSVAPSEAEVERGREVRIHFVRRVAPNKDMYCLTFRLWPECVWS